jgi:transposase
MGIRGRVSRNTLANANQVRDWRIYGDFAQILISTARRLYVDDSFGVQLNQTVYALDSTTIDLCLALFPWARFRKHKGAVKLHTLLDLRGNIPTVLVITHGKVHDVNFLDQLVFEPGAFYVMDRGYTDFERLYNITLASAFFVTCARRNFAFNRLYSLSTDESAGMLSDQIISLQGFYSRKSYPDKLRRIRFHDTEHDRYLVFLTNNFSHSALTIAQLYRCRWQVELFFKWIKQHLRIKAFYGTTPNALKTQIWIAISVYLLVAIVKKQLNLTASLYKILQVASVTVFEKTPILEAFNNIEDPAQESESLNQLNLFE